VSICPELEDDQLYVRNSMEKFKSDHHELEVVQYTKPGRFMLFLCRLIYSRLCIALSSRLSNYTISSIIVSNKAYLRRLE